MSEASEFADRVKREVFEEVEKVIQFDDSGRDAAEAIWTQTLGHFFGGSITNAMTKWRHPKVREYGMSAVREIAVEAQRISGAGSRVTRVQIDSAANIVIGRRRPPVEIDPGGGCELCTGFRLH